MTRLTGKFFLPAGLIFVLNLGTTVNAATLDQGYGCMAHGKRGVAEGSTELRIYVKPTRQSAFRDLGYRPVPCDEADGRLDDYMQTVCAFASDASNEIQAEFKGVYGATPSQLCEAVK